MANLKEIRTRIASVTSTRQITSAMKMVSAAKLRKAQDAIVQLRPYADKLHEILSTLSTPGAGEDNPYAKIKEPDKVLIVVITSNRGLCGTFTTNVLKAALQLAYENYPKQLNERKVFFMPIGKKGADFFIRRNYLVTPGNYNELLHNPTFEEVVPVAEYVMESFLNNTYDRVDVVYNQFKNAAVQLTVAEQFLPVVPMPAPTDQKTHKSKNIDFIFEPSIDYIIRELIPKSLKMQLYKMITDSVASEHGARMTAMHKATDNATDLIRDLKLQYNKARQSSITNEILEIVSGANALKG